MNLLVENRVRREYDGMLADHGIVIWYIDDNKSDNVQKKPGWPGQDGWPGNNNYYQFAVIQADGLNKLESGVNLGSLPVADLWKSGMSLEPSGKYPNTMSYSSGAVTVGILVSDSAGFRI